MVKWAIRPILIGAPKRPKCFNSHFEGVFTPNIDSNQFYPSNLFKQQSQTLELRRLFKKILSYSKNQKLKIKLLIKFIWRPMICRQSGAQFNVTT